MRPVSGAEVLCTALEAGGVECVFGLPGTQTVGIYEALRQSRLRSIVPTHELGAAFMANGYARASGKVGVVLTIPGPGFAYTIAGLAEARLDNVALVLITLEPNRGPTGEAGFQGIDHEAIARPLLKGVIRVQDFHRVRGAVAEALSLAFSENPGPVLLQIAEECMRAAGRPEPVLESSRLCLPDEGSDAFVAEIARARRPVIVVAGDFANLSDAFARVAVSCHVPICVLAPNRGVVAEDHPWALCFDEVRTPYGDIQQIMGLTDLALVFGTQLGHVSTCGFRLKLPDNVLCMSVEGKGLPHGYSANRISREEPARLLDRLLEAARTFAAEWTAAELALWRSRSDKKRPIWLPEPSVNGASAAEFFSRMRRALPRDAIVVTDSGLHQGLVRRHYPVLAPHGLLFPSDFQSMGYGLAAGLGAKLAVPSRQVIVVMGDGGFAMSGMELLTAARDRIPLIVVVFNDGYLNLIRLQQLGAFGKAHAVGIDGPDLERFAAAARVRYRTTNQQDVEAVFREAASEREPTLIEVPVGDSVAVHRVHAVSAAREVARSLVGPHVVGWLKRRLR